jgi:hypothetical protein
MAIGHWFASGWARASPRRTGLSSAVISSAAGSPHPDSSWPSCLLARSRSIVRCAPAHAFVPAQVSALARWLPMSNTRSAAAGGAAAALVLATSVRLASNQARGRFGRGALGPGAIGQMPGPVAPPSDRAARRQRADRERGLVAVGGLGRTGLGPPVPVTAALRQTAEHDAQALIARTSEPRASRFARSGRSAKAPWRARALALLCWHTATAARRKLAVGDRSRSPRLGRNPVHRRGVAGHHLTPRVFVQLIQQSR